MTDGGLPASKKLKAADGSSAAAPVVAEDEPSGLPPPSIQTGVVMGKKLGGVFFLEERDAEKPLNWIDPKTNARLLVTKSIRGLL